MKLPPVEFETKKPLRASLPAKTALIASLTPLFVALLASTVAAIHLTKEGRRASITEATATSRWIADRLATFPRDDWEPALRRVERELDGEVELLDKAGTLVFPADSDDGDKERSSRAKRRKGRDRTTSQAGFTSSGDQFRVVVALPPTTIGASVWGSFTIKIGIAASVLLFAAIVCGYLFGATVSDELAHLDGRLRAMISVSGPRIPVTATPSQGVGELPNVVRAISGLEERFASELVLYKDALEEVRAFGAQRTTYLKAIARELHKPLDSILQETEALLDRPDAQLTETQREDLQIIQKAGKRLLAGVEEILDLSALMSDDLRYDPDPIDLVEVAAEVVETAQGDLGDKNVSVSLERRTPGEISVHGNRQRLWQIITNLVSNAIKFTEQGEVKIALGRTADGKVTMEVIDTGVGIPVGDQEGIFDPFAQSGEISKRRRGTGLGLAIVQRLVRLHGGEIYVSSREGEGSKFTVKLP